MNEPKTLVIAKEIAKRVGLISNRKAPNKWFSEVAYCGVGATMPPISKPGVIAFVEVDSWSDTKLSAGNHEARISIKVRGYIENSQNPHEEVHRLARDIVNVVAEAESDMLGGLVIDIDGSDYTVAAEFAEQAGRGEATVSISATYRWSHGSP